MIYGEIPEKVNHHINLVNTDNKNSSIVGKNALTLRVDTLITVYIPNTIFQ